MQTRPIITVFGGGPGFGLPEVSHYTAKTLVQLQMAGLPYTVERSRPDASPKKTLPFIDDAGMRIADSTFIRAHIEAKYGVDLDAGLTPIQRAQAWAIERMVENQLGWTVSYFRFLDDANFERGPAHWFDAAPEAARPALRQNLRDQAAATHYAVGVGRHEREEIVGLAELSLSALSILLGDQAYLMGDHPTGVDAVTFATLAGALTPFFDSPLRRRVESHAKLLDYVGRMMARYFPEHPWMCEASLAA